MPWSPDVMVRKTPYFHGMYWLCCYYCVGVDEKNPCKRGAVVASNRSLLPTCGDCSLRRAKLEQRMAVLLCLNRRTLNSGATPFGGAAHAHFNGNGQGTWEEIMSYVGDW